MELFILYIWLKLNAIGVLLVLLAVSSTLIGAIGSIVSWCMSQDYPNDDSYKVAHKLFRKLLFSAMFFIPAAVLLPSKTDVAVLVGGHYALKLADTPEASKVMSLLRKKANDLLDEELKGKTK